MSRIQLNTEQCCDLLAAHGLTQQPLQPVSLQTLLSLIQTSYTLGYNRDIIKTTYKELSK